MAKRRTKRGESKTSPRRMRAVERQRQCLELRIAGYTYDVIAEQVGYSDGSMAYKAVIAGIQKTLQEPADEVRNLEVARLDKLLAGIYLQAKQGNLPAMDRVLKLMERRAKLLGLDRPVQWEVSGPSGGPIPVKEVVIAIGPEDKAS